MTIVSITRILDESDIVEAFVRHTAHYASRLIFVDNGSRDGTIEILDSLKQEGFDIVVFQNLSVAYNELQFNTFMYRKAIELFDADWVLCLDADEFIDDRALADGLKRTLRGLSPEALCVRVPMIEYRRSRDDDRNEIIVPARLNRRTEVTDNTKIFLSGKLAGPDFQIGGGNHFAFLGERRIESVAISGLMLAHYAERSAYQVAAKWIKGWAKVLAGGPDVIEAGPNSHYKQPFRILCDTPEALFRNPGYFLDSPGNEDLAIDPIAYEGGPLLFTSSTDDAMRSTRMIMGYLEELAMRYGRLTHECADARQLSTHWDADLVGLIGVEGGGEATGGRTQPGQKGSGSMPSEEPIAETTGWKRSLRDLLRKLVGGPSR